MAGTTIDFPSNSHTCSGYLAVPASGRGPGIVVIQEWWGLVPHIRNLCDRLAAEGFVALAPDLYHGDVASEPDDAGKKMMGLRIDEATRDMSGAVTWLLGSDSVVGESVGVVGFCMGGGLALMLAAVRPEVAAAIAFYPVAPWDQSAPSFSDIRANVLVHWGLGDDFNDAAKRREVEAQLTTAPGDAEFFTYDADHAFFNDDRPEVYAEDASRLAWDRTLALLRTRLAVRA